MEDFKLLENKSYVGYVVTNKSKWDANYRRYMNTRHMLFNSERAAQRCVDILVNYSHMQYQDTHMHTVIVKDLFMFDGTVLHGLSGLKLNIELYMRDNERVKKIEKTFNETQWGYLDGYVELFGLTPYRRRRGWVSALICISCACCCLNPFHRPRTRSEIDNGSMDP